MAASDENTFAFAPGQNGNVRRVKAYVERRIAELRREDAGAVPASAAPDVAVQLEKLAQLRAQGLLSEEEFARAKARLLGT